MFIETITFQVKPDKVIEFEEMARVLKGEMAEREGCRGVSIFKRFYTFDKVEWGQPPREISRVVKCVKYFAQWEFEDIESCGRATGWLMEEKSKEIFKLLIMPFEINSGYEI